MTQRSTEPAGVAASVLIGLEALGVALLAGWQVVAIVTGDVAELPSAIALVVLTVVGAVAVGAFAVATARGLSWGRSGGVVCQLLLLAVAGGAVTGTYAHPLIGLTLAVPAVIGLVLLIIATRRAAPRRTEGESPRDE